MSCLIVYTTYPTIDEASIAARKILEKGLASCINTLGNGPSFYKWEGLVREVTEIPVIIKTSEEKWAALKAFIEETHPYEIPAILAVPTVRANEAFLKWMNEQLN